MEEGERSSFHLPFLIFVRERKKKERKRGNERKMEIKLKEKALKFQREMVKTLDISRPFPLCF